MNPDQYPAARKRLVCQPQSPGRTTGPRFERLEHVSGAELCNVRRTGRLGLLRNCDSPVTCHTAAARQQRVHGLRSKPQMPFPMQKVIRTEWLD